VAADLGEVLAANVRAERARRKWSQRELGDRLGMAQRTVSDLENGRAVTVPELLALCGVFGVTARQLLTGADPADLRTLGL
jgi:transcriptional regulator with XRE-family HTH domain